MGVSSVANGENEIVFSKMSGLPVGVGGGGGIDRGRGLDAVDALTTCLLG